MLTLLLTRNLRASLGRPQPVLLLLITVSQEQEFTFPFVGPCTSLYNPISSLYRVAIPSWVCTALPAVSHTNLDSRCTQCYHLGQFQGCRALLAPASTLRSSVYEWHTVWLWAIDYHLPVRQFSILLMALNIMGCQPGHNGTIASSILLKSR